MKILLVIITKILFFLYAKLWKRQKRTPKIAKLLAFLAEKWYDSDSTAIEKNKDRKQIPVFVLCLRFAMLCGI